MNTTNAGAWRGTVAAAAVLLLPVCARAQGTLPIDAKRWDVSGSVVSLATGRISVGCQSYVPCDELVGYGVEAGRYWTTHLKTEVAVVMTRPAWSTDYGTFPGGTTYSDREYRLTTVAPAVTYQFRENVFVHPFVSGGIRLGWLQSRYLPTEVHDAERRTRYFTPAVNERVTSVHARPFAGGGVKFYFGERVYLRPEAVTTFGSPGVTDVRTSVGFGFDF
jgi:hypothetical protein